MDIFANINAGKYRNNLPYARPKEDRAVFDAYQAETARLNALFETDLIAYLELEPGPVAEKLFAFAWEKGHSSGFSEVAIEALDAAELFKAGLAEERARIRKGFEASIDALQSASLNNAVLFDSIRRQLLRDLDFIVPERE